MNRTALTDPDTGLASGTWFDQDRAEKISEGREWDGSNWISLATGSQWHHEILWHTASGRWVLNTWSQQGNIRERYVEIPEGEAYEWLIANGHSDMVPEEEVDSREVGAGATPRRAIRIADDLWEAIKARARAENTDASELMRRLATEYLGC